MREAASATLSVLIEQVEAGEPHSHRAIGVVAPELVTPEIVAAVIPPHDDLARLVGVLADAGLDVAQLLLALLLTPRRPLLLPPGAVGLPLLVRPLQVGVARFRVGVFG